MSTESTILTETLHHSAPVKEIAHQNGLNYLDCLDFLNAGKMDLEEFIRLANNGEGWLIASALARFVEDEADLMDNPIY